MRSILARGCNWGATGHAVGNDGVGYWWEVWCLGKRFVGHSVGRECTTDFFGTFELVIFTP